tara:strand:+ start:901 stop:1491 length:591 start_codon:yes stop_codon:yes gene_type:complete
MSQRDPIATGVITWLGTNQTRKGFSRPRQRLIFRADGIKGDRYRGFTRNLSGHDGPYIRRSGLEKRDVVVNHRPITGAEETELEAATRDIGQPVLPGMLRENVIFLLKWNMHEISFSTLPPRSLIVIGKKRGLILETTEENSPCDGVARPYAEHYGEKSLLPSFIKHLQHRRGQMIRVFSAGTAFVGDPVEVYWPV